LCEKIFEDASFFILLKYLKE